jgi:hypothetical protein
VKQSGGLRVGHSNHMQNAGVGSVIRPLAASSLISWSALTH